MRSAARHGARDVGAGTWELEAGLREGVGVQAPAIDLDPQQLLQAHVAEAHLRSEVIEQRELAGLGGGLERHGLRARSEEHTSELQSRSDLVCRLLLEKKNHQTSTAHMFTARSYSTTRDPSPTPSRAIAAAICSTAGIMNRRHDARSDRSSVRSANPLL